MTCTSGGGASSRWGDKWNRVRQVGEQRNRFEARALDTRVLCVQLVSNIAQRARLENQMRSARPNGNSRRGRSPSLLLLLAAVLLASVFAVTRAVPSTIFPDECYNNFDLLEWDVKRFGPYTICKGGVVRLQWKGMHGVFQIPSIACPTNFTSGQTDDYKYLAAVSNGGGYEWEVPDPPNGTHGHYWITSQQPFDCAKGMVAEFFVVDPDMKPFPSSEAWGGLGWSWSLGLGWLLLCI